MNILVRIGLVSLALIGTLSTEVRAEVPTLEILGGLSSPAPGISGNVGLCWRMWRRGCVGGSIFGSRNEITKDDVTINSTYFTGSVEHAFALSDDYHLLWINGVAGLGYYRRKMNDSAKPEDESWTKIAPSVGAGMGFELPLADLIGMRFGVLTRKALISGSSTQVAFVAGFRVGSEWLGFGE